MTAMTPTRYYKTPLVFAITLHLILGIFLSIKFINSKSVAMKSANSFINAVVVNERDIDDQVNKIPEAQIVKPSESKVQVAPAVIPQKKVQANANLQKDLLLEEAKEMAELKKAVLLRKKNAQEKAKEQQMQKTLQEQAKAEQDQLTKEARVAHGRQIQGEVDKYKAVIIQAISSQWIVPDGVDKGSSCQLLINVAPGGVVLDVKIVVSSGNAVLDRSAESAVLKASPLPVPENAEIFDNFRVIKLTVRPDGVSSQ